MSFSWWRHQMETFSALLSLCAENSLVTGESLAQRPVTQSFDVFLDLHLNKRLSKQSWGWWFETPSHSLWRYCNVYANFSSLMAPWIAKAMTWDLAHWLSYQYRNFYTLTSSILCIHHETCWAETNSSVLFYLTESTAADIVGTSWNETEHDDVMTRKSLKQVSVLTHWGRVTHICVSELTIIGSDNGLSPGRRQVIIWNNAGLLLIEPLGTNFSEISIGSQIFSFKKMHLRMSSGKWRPFCLGFNVLRVRFVHGSCSVVFGYGLVQAYCYISFRVTSLALVQSYDFPRAASEATLSKTS